MHIIKFSHSFGDIERLICLTLGLRGRACSNECNAVQDALVGRSPGQKSRSHACACQHRMLPRLSMRTDHGGSSADKTLRANARRSNEESAMWLIVRPRGVALCVIWPCRRLRAWKMSSIYVLEPPTKGKVLLNTSLGPLDFELWPKEAPKAVRIIRVCFSRSCYAFSCFPLLSLLSTSVVV